MSSIIITPQGPTPDGPFGVNAPFSGFAPPYNFSGLQINIQGAELSWFTLQIAKSGGVTSHAIMKGANNLAPAIFTGKINAASAVPVGTPSVSNVVGFGGKGGGIDAAATNVFIFDNVNDQVSLPDQFVGIASVVKNGTTNPVYVRPRSDYSKNVNGVTWNRLAFIFTDASGVAVDLTGLPNTAVTTDVLFLGFLL